MSEPDKLITFSDGGARGNPGPAAIGAVLYQDDGVGNLKLVAEIKKFIGQTTNNFAEYQALIAALEKAQELGYLNLKCYLDSELVVKQLRGQYKIREETLKPLAQRVLILTNKFVTVSFNHVPREKNSAADKLVNQALDENESLA